MTSSNLTKISPKSDSIPSSISSMVTPKPSAWLPPLWPIGVWNSCTQCWWSQASAWTRTWSRRRATSRISAKWFLQPWESPSTWSSTNTRKPLKWPKFWVCFPMDCNQKWWANSSHTQESAGETQSKNWWTTLWFSAFRREELGIICCTLT